jgi:hypothetical protein
MSRAEQVREKALRLAFRTGIILNVQAVWDEQEAAGERACYGTSNHDCSHGGCCFRESCVQLSTESLATPIDQVFARRLAS